MGINMLHRRERLIITTIELLDESGIQGLSTREIAKREGVSEATIFRHFKNKNELLAAVLDYFSQYDADIVKSIKLKKLAPMEAIVYLITAYTEYYENYPAITSILHLFDIFRYESGLEDKVKEIYSKRNNTIQELIEEAKRAGEMRPDINSGYMADAISGLCREMSLRWRISGRSFSLCERTLAALKMFHDAFGK